VHKGSTAGSQLSALTVLRFLVLFDGTARVYLGGASSIAESPRRRRPFVKKLMPDPDF
jgi:hypothetical protein